MRILKLAFMVLGIFLSWYFAGPIMAELARSAFEIYYSWRYGYIPSVWSLEYYFTFMPMRGHVTYYAYLYANKICALIAAPLFYKLPDMIVACFRNHPDEIDYLDSKYEKEESIQANDFLDEPNQTFFISHKTKPSIKQNTVEDAYSGREVRRSFVA